jgi:hypothetical protein
MENNNFSENQLTIWSWALKICDHWVGKIFDRKLSFDQFRQVNDISESLYIFHIRNGDVIVLEKPECLEHIEKHQGMKRSTYYAKFLKNVAQEWLPNLDVMLCISMADSEGDHPYLPIFCFQKIDGLNQILIPDIDFLTNNFYLDANFQDNTLYKDKFPEAIFVGSTTGSIITNDDIYNSKNPRLCAANFFWKINSVTFLLPSVVQCDSNDTFLLINELPFCKAERISWSEQLKYLFLISIDGNGATCSRVALALRSNSVLLKYDSPYKLYYHYFLEPNIHYVPISYHENVIDIVNCEAENPGMYSDISRSANKFSELYLCEREIKFYMAAVLRIYDGIFSGQNS